jgi:hypothetical protein
MWRKNRNPNGNVGCNGVDLNRNFGYYWLTSGASRSPCSEVYAVCFLFLYLAFS